MQTLQISQAIFQDATHTDETNLANILAMKPDYSPLIVQAMSDKNIMNGEGLLLDLTANRGALEVGSDTHIWRVQGRTTSPQPITGTASPAVNTGQGGQPFTVPFPTRYFSEGDVCRFADDSHARVEGDPIPTGNSWLYTFKIVSSDRGAFVQPLALEPGREVAFIYSAFEEASIGGAFKRGTFLQYQNGLTTIRTSATVTGSAKNTSNGIFEIKVPTGGGGSKSIWWYEYQMGHNKYHLRQTELSLLLGRYNRDSSGQISLVSSRNGNPIKTGSGLFEQMAQANIVRTNKFTYGLLRAVVNQINTQQRWAMGQNKKLLMITGTGGYEVFQLAMKDYFSSIGSGLVTCDHFIKALDGRNLSLGGEFRTFIGPDGTEMTIVKHPLLDDPSYFPRRVGNLGYTDYSYKMFIIDTGLYGGVPNLQLMTRGVPGENRRSIVWQTGGSTLPGPGNPALTGNSVRSHSGDFGSVHYLSEVSLKLNNPLACYLIDATPDA